MVTYNAVVKYIINPIHNWRIHIYICTQVPCFLTNYLCFFFTFWKQMKLNSSWKKERKKNPDEIGNQSKHV